MKVALVSYDFGEYCIRLASALAAEIDVNLQLAESLAAGHLAEVAPSVRFQPFRKPRLRQAPQQLKTIATIVRRLRRFDPDIVHLQQGHLWFNCALPMLRRYPLVLTVHDARHHLGDKDARKTPQGVTHYGVRRASRVIVHSQQQKRFLAGLCRVDQSRIDVIPHIALGNKSADSGSCPVEARVLFFGRIWEYKGLEYLIRAEPLISSAVPEAKIVIAGEGEDFSRYRRMMMHPSQFIVHNEYVSDDARSALFQEASVVVLPYVEASQSGVIPLAYRFGKPVIATTVGGLPEMVEHGRTGLLVPPRDEQSLAAAIVHLLRNDNLRRQLGAEGSRMLDCYCAPDVVARETLAVYRRAVAA
ncbi:MAG: glycosyltransferase family 4 protein [Chloroflexi bacterium]|nr:glycosyltransferase family 4 protein [Chloroflexota bacterium]